MIVPMGALFMTIMTEGTAPGTIATRSQLTSWIGRTRAPFTMVLDSADPQPDMESYFSRPRDTIIIVDLRTMTIVEIVASDVNRALTDLRMLLQ